MIIWSKFVSVDIIVLSVEIMFCISLFTFFFFGGVPGHRFDISTGKSDQLRGISS